MENYNMSMRFNYGYQDMPKDVIAQGNRYVLEKITNLDNGKCCILTCLATSKVISSYANTQNGLNDMARREHEDILLDIKEYVYINDKIKEY